VALGQLDEFIQRPGSPNLYWSLTDLPQPFVDLRLGMQGERVAIIGTFPNLPVTRKDAGKVMTPEQVQQTIKLAEGLQRDDFFFNVPRGVFEANLALDVRRKHERAKRALVEAGWPSDAVEQMPHVQVALLHGFLDYDRTLDEATKCIGLPYWRSAPELLELDKKRRTFHGIPSPEQPAIPIGSLLSPASGRVLWARTRLERKVAALRCLEALRLYGAGHGGKLPVRLADIKEVPVPVDPFTGRPFEYEATDTRAMLYAPAVAVPIPGRKPLPQDALCYEIVLKR
jgi:hypothetical protein